MVSKEGLSLSITQSFPSSERPLSSVTLVEGATPAMTCHTFCEERDSFSSSWASMNWSDQLYRAHFTPLHSYRPVGTIAIAQAWKDSKCSHSRKIVGRGNSLSEYRWFYPLSAENRTLICALTASFCQNLLNKHSLYHLSKSWRPVWWQQRHRLIPVSACWIANLSTSKCWMSN